MEKVARIFTSFKDADAADVEEDLRMTPEQRVALVIELRERVYPNASQQGLERICRITQLKQG